jgi:putative PIN family toxin of toxin-antitoxin system
MRFLYDTSVLVTLTRREELSRFRQLLTGEAATHVTSEYIMAEMERVLTSKFGFTRQKARVTTNAIAKLSDVVSPRVIDKVSRDSLDDYILAAALVGEAQFLVTLDADLLVLGDYRGVKIISPKQFKNLT